MGAQCGCVRDDPFVCGGPLSGSSGGCKCLLVVLRATDGGLGVLSLSYPR